MSHSITSRRGTTRRRRRASRSGSPPVRRLARSVRRRSVRRPWRAALVAARAPQRRGDLEPRHQPVELRELVRVERVEALARQPLLVARHRERHLDLGGVLVALAAAPRRAGDAEPRRSPRRPPLRRAAARPAARPRRAVRRAGRHRPGPPRRRPRRTPGRTPCACAWSETNTERAVQYSRRRDTGRTSVSARAKSAGRSGVIGTPASCRRRLSAAASGGRSRWIVSTPKSVTASARAARGRPRGSPPGPRRT